MASSNPKVDAALKWLRMNGHKIGEASVSGDGVMLIPIDDVPRTFEQIFEMVNEARRKDFIHPDKATERSSPDDDE